MDQGERQVNIKEIWGAVRGKSPPTNGSGMRPWIKLFVDNEPVDGKTTVSLVAVLPNGDSYTLNMFPASEETQADMVLDFHKWLEMMPKEP